MNSESNTKFQLGSERANPNCEGLARGALAGGGISKANEEKSLSSFYALMNHNDNNLSDLQDIIIRLYRIRGKFLGPLVEDSEEKVGTMRANFVMGYLSDQAECTSKMVPEVRSLVSSLETL